MHKMECALREDPETAPPEILDRRLHNIRSSALALQKYKEKLPPKKVTEYEVLLRDWFGLTEDQELTALHLQEADEIESRLPNPKYISGATLVLESLNNSDEAIEVFVREWREFFLETMDPRFLPAGWDVGSPVQSDRKDKDETHTD
jgi:hypothetical protein